MLIRLRFFASVRETLGTASEELVLPDDVRTVGDVRELLVARGGDWERALGASRSVRMAFNQVMCDAVTLVQEGGEVAFFRR